MQASVAGDSLLLRPGNIKAAKKESLKGDFWYDYLIKL